MVLCCMKFSGAGYPTCPPKRGGGRRNPPAAAAVRSLGGLRYADALEAGWGCLFLTIARAQRRSADVEPS
jgi:hypothetical protein